MKKKVYLFLGMLSFSLGGMAQNMLITLEECQKKTKENYPLIRQYDLVSLTEKYNLENLVKNFYPQISLNGQASYQSDVTKMPIKIPGMNVPTMDKDQYKITLDVSQVLWDGGTIRSQSVITKANAALEKSKTDVSLYAVQDKVNQLYFGILTLDEQLKQLDVLTSDLQTNYNWVAAMLKNGVAMVSDLDLVKVELLNAEQNKIEMQTMREAYLKMLSLFVHESLDPSTKLEQPGDILDWDHVIRRPELSFYESQRGLYKAQESSVKAKNSPKFSLFAQGGYGKPGLNMLEPDFKTFAIGGLRLNWNFGNLYTRKNERKLIENNRQQVDVQEEVFLFNTQVQLTQIKNEIGKYQKLLEKDNEIIQLRNRVKLAGESKYKNGIYQMNDWIGDINAENRARITQALHKMQYLQTIYNYKYVQGN
ncbi:TolC family protein [Apibacter sp. HY039]|uniref:TolC family protein n=1 Tax=Apibacter sp. HY039 TaxID=2501476 RepID=UPI000FEBAA0E|nr:TolC family protein [Apibacter sp. HY039]